MSTLGHCVLGKEVKTTVTISVILDLGGVHSNDDSEVNPISYVTIEFS